ncbi:chitobiase/beta-hexosaminidase C-terminal domain-containing protein [Pelotomaculum terephthalicicum JT]|uniref:chitobiase/beta-hexosaminidase C-terminal domain-containing protein n=1 Tax=Pelotomaculum terephthalicicum TaxID=206393 RepID=UPI001F04ECAE|nr:chitobiase/beta-hexosaminidase C-terminal domain-containing protein [Pelotomaculum terephthalicicum]MCG9967268.1 chitobiase/beta-hexosaminidase C-terminal domain-containing protein [Pelotomaculum terephthalicicum JT]
MEHYRRLNFRKLAAGLVMLSVVIGFLVTATPRVSSADDTIALTVRGNGVEREVSFTMDELRALPQATYTYSGYNHWPSLQIYRDSTGPTLKTILAVAGLKDSATMFRFKQASSGYHDITRAQLLEDLRYYFPAGEATGDLSTWPPTNRSEEGKVPVEAMIEIGHSEGTLMYGQRSPIEPTACHSEQLQNLVPGGIIEVTTAPPPQWEAPDAYPAPGTVTPGTEVTLQHGDGTPYGAIVYYTLDGSEPTVKSNIFNISYPTFQPKLNKPIPITGDMTIKTRTIGIGKLDSEVVTYQYNLGALACTIEGEELSKPVKYAVETLKEMDPAQGTYQCKEDGSSVDLAGKGVLLGTLLDSLGVSGLSQVKFVTAGGEEYNGGTVQELKNQQCLLAYEVNGAAVADASGSETVYIQILRSLNNDYSPDNRLKYVNKIKLVNVADKVTISNVTLLDCQGRQITSVAAGGGYCIKARLVNAINAAKDALLIIQLRNGAGATATTGGSVVGCAAVQAVVAASGGEAVAEFTLPAGLSGKAYVDVFIWDNYDNKNPLGRSYHALNFDIT